MHFLEGQVKAELQAVKKVTPSAQWRHGASNTMECDSKVADTITPETKWTKHCPLRLGGGAGFAITGVNCLVLRLTVFSWTLLTPHHIGDALLALGFPSADQLCCFLAEFPMKNMVYLADNDGTNSCATGELVHSEEECITFAKILGAGLPVTRSKEHWPKGCILKRDGTVHYNSANAGAAKDIYSPVCKRNKTTEE